MSTYELTIKTTRRLRSTSLGNLLSVVADKVKAVCMKPNSQNSTPGSDAMLDYSWENPVRYGQAN